MQQYKDKYVDEILKKFGFSTVKTASTPMETSMPLMKDENAEDIDVHLYRSMIGSLMYLTSLRPDIMFADSPFNLEAYTDSDYAGANLDRKSTTGVPLLMSDDPSPSSSPVKTSDNFVKFADELAPLNSLPPGNDDSTLKKDLHEENFQENVEIKNSNVSDKLVFLNTPLSDKDECFAPEDDNDEIDDFLAIEVSSNLEEGYFDSEGDIAFLDNTSYGSLHHEFAGEPSTLPARNDREFEEYLSLMTVLNEISTSQGNFQSNSVIESLPVSILVEES
ncbi:hypothetical protein Tco_1428503 [Tanacetum coccineum]